MMAMFEAAILSTLKLSQIKQLRNLPDLYEQNGAAETVFSIVVVRSVSKDGDLFAFDA